MDKIRIVGGQKLNGRTAISRAESRSAADDRASPSPRDADADNVTRLADVACCRRRR
jgi:hypothetical protein